MNNLKFSNLKPVRLMARFKTSFLFFLVAATLLISCGDKKTHQEMLAHIIKPEKAVEIYKNYEEQRLNILNDTLRAIYDDDNFNDTRRVWFDLKTLKNYIAYVEKKSAKNKITPEGLQFYFSVYSNDEDGDEKNHQTFFIAPTTENKGKQSGYTLHEVDGETQPLFLKTILNSGRYSPSQNQQMEKASFFSITMASEEDGLLYNDGTCSPPDDDIVE